jgi:hypothetical protein
MATIIFGTNQPISDDDRGAERSRCLRWSRLTLNPADEVIVTAELTRLSDGERQRAVIDLQFARLLARSPAPGFCHTCHQGR